MDTQDKAGMEKGIEELYQQLYQKMLTCVLKDPECFMAAEDIVQEAFYEAVRNWDRLEQHENRAGWMMETVKFKMLAYKKRISRRSIYETAQVEEEIACFKNEYGMVELDILMDKELSPQEKALFHMFYMAGYPSKELAQMKDLTEGNIRVMLHRIRRKLQNALNSKKK